VEAECAKRFSSFCFWRRLLLRSVDVSAVRDTSVFGFSCDEHGSSEMHIVFDAAELKRYTFIESSLSSSSYGVHSCTFKENAGEGENSF
jgi:hypothetical protein